MALPTLLPLAGAAIAPVLEKVVDSITEGLSFLDVLHQPPQSGDATAVQVVEANTLPQDVAQLADRLRERFASLGIDMRTPVRLKQDGREQVIVDGDHPDRVLIESVFGTDEQLTKLFAAVADSAASGRPDRDSGITQEFRFILGKSDAVVEFV